MGVNPGVSGQVHISKYPCLQVVSGLRDTVHLGGILGFKYQKYAILIII